MTPAERWLWALAAQPARKLQLSDTEFGGMPNVMDFEERSIELLGSHFEVADVKAGRRRLKQRLKQAKKADLDAWATAECVLLSGLMCRAGWVRQHDVTPDLHVLAREIRQRYDSWAAFGHAFLLGQAREEGRCRASDEKRCLSLLVNDPSPWRELKWDDYPVAIPPPTVAFQIFVACRQCGRQSRLFHVAKEHVCVSCFAPIVVPKKQWKDIVQDHVEEALAQGPDCSAYTTQGFNGDIMFSCRVRRAWPRCGCGAEIALDDTVLDDLATGKRAVTCGRCGVALDVPELNDFARSALPKCLALTGQRPDWSVAYVKQPIRHGAAIGCSTCGAPLRLDTIQRHVSCRFCQGTTELPEEVWRRLVPIDRDHWMYFWTQSS